MNFIVRLIGRHARRPEGFIGRIILNRMARMTRPSFTWTADELDLKPDHEVVDIGFGNGESLGVFVDRLPDGRVVGLEISDTMIDMAAKTHAHHIAAGRMELVKTEIGPIPLSDECCDRVATMNTAYITEKPLEMFRELHRLLRDGGIAAVTFPEREAISSLPMSKTEGFYLHELDDLEAAMREAGFRRVDVLANDDLPTPYRCVRGHKTAGSSV